LYLKCLEMIGFKSFAGKTKLDFEPGMTAIVGPNGCGKSNISDAVRWVLGEQSAKALRGSRMEDVIFNGTDTQKALGMAEVSLTLADCEASLGMEFNEVTVTRRVFRSGEGQYFINKAPCRLKDIQRLFMDTGIGTNSYSLMEQGRIDRILSSRPDDRREVFEEASGITKFKADKREAIRKLEQTEANLLRLSDIIREVKRQIISLQRQAGKARRYQVLQEQLRSFDLFASRERLRALDAELRTLESRLASVSEQDEAARQDIRDTEQRTAALRASLQAADQEIAATMEAAIATRTELDRIRDLLKNNQDRIQELQSLADRDDRDAREAKARREQHASSLAAQTADLGRGRAHFERAERELGEHTEKLNRGIQAVDEASRFIHRLRTDQVELDVQLANAQNELTAIEAAERNMVFRRERLAAEHAEIQRSLDVFARREGEMSGRLEGLRSSATQGATELSALLERQTDRVGAVASAKSDLSDLRARAAARRAQVDLLQQSRDAREGFAQGARLLLGGEGDLARHRAAILGPLAEKIRAREGYDLALEAALRPWLDAIVVDGSEAALRILRDLEAGSGGSARLLFARDAAGAESPRSGAGDRLIDHLLFDEPLRPLVETLLGSLLVVNRSGDIPHPLPPGAVYVTRTGAVLGTSGTAEFWKRESADATPLAREHLLAEWTDELSRLEADIAAHDKLLRALAEEEVSLAESINRARSEVDERRHALALAEGEHQVVSQEAGQAREKVDTVAWELKALEEQHHEGGDRRATIVRDIESLRDRQAEIRKAISEKTEALRDLEQEKSRLVNEATDFRIRFAEARQSVENLSSKIEQTSARIAELEALIDERQRGVTTYHERIQELKREIAEAQGRVGPLAEENERLTHRIETARARRDEQNAALSAVEGELREKRSMMEEIRNRRSQIDIEIAEQRIRRQNMLDRVTSDYRVAQDAVLSAAEPAWENGQAPDRDALETMIAELRTKIDAMGPVNLVAIEEHRELEERHAFLTVQQNDLVNAKQQLMDMIRQINKTTTELFAQTFEQVNRNFQEMFAKLFGGGTAKLVLVDEGDVLESGIEIIARPPGKKLQTVSLLSGGERTMTAVALLFSLYLVKPSPFCLLDELDAALDDANIGRFVRTVQGFMEKSQFVVITHNRQTISAAAVLYGVTMEERGVSKIVSVKFSAHEARGEAVAAPAGPAAS
jgi:chromosome segregation protein